MLFITQCPTTSLVSAEMLVSAVVYYHMTLDIVSTRFGILVSIKSGSIIILYIKGLKRVVFGALLVLTMLQTED